MTCISPSLPSLRSTSVGVLGFMLASSLMPVAAPAQESFFDSFEEFDTSRWFVSDGWTNGPHQNCWWSSRAVQARDGQLVLKLQASDDPEQPFICGEVQTRQRFEFGTYETRFRTDRASGVIAAFFTYIGEVHDQPHDEIDIEVLTRDPGRVEFNTFVDGEMLNGHQVDLPAPADEVFHHYAFIWEEDRIRWFLNGVLMHEATENLVEHAQKIYLSHWSTDQLTDWMGEFEDPGRPLEMHIDWVAWTAPGKDCAFPESILCQEDIP